MSPPTDPDDLSPADRARELAGLFATALARLLRTGPATPPPGKTLPENSPNELAVPANESVTVHAG